ncbi:MAG: peptide ABC transporter permease [Candidatus Glassbacteria bacterium RIFCSPLOWO2_12_FULL_58_11]|uniref:Peptide ABC transporter permease n=2 Tax=Candidatus Glassiibacteriota TaxID=1817805 RepID=A0A1F5YPB6_9BACT|nr:MAG: peptide ABC transporter permease [Candidatus Glassbacteria bacterium GWA2_58_10]OGG01966.1 MAG: peptide ABC transporter permease [Candidatus Glassbacteria bacterium RIFCSPLOWO2_12_FULL_58_11]
MSLRAYRSITLRIGLALVLLLVLSALCAGLLAPCDPLRVDVASVMAPPSLAHPFGTDYLGRDVLSRVLYGGRISLTVGVLAVIISGLAGTLVGALAGFAGGWVDEVLMRLTDIVLAFPTALLALAVMAIFENPTVGKIFIVLGLVGWANIARLVRAEVLAVKERDFVTAARSVGVSPLGIVIRHILPNTLGTLTVALTLGVAGNILTEAWLSFLGLGAQPPLPSWGAMITEGQYFLTTRPWVCIFPGLAILLTVLGFNMLGDGLRDVLDPRLNPRGRR